MAEKNEEYQVKTTKSRSTQGWRMTKKDAEALRESMIKKDGFEPDDVEVVPQCKALG